MFPETRHFSAGVVHYWGIKTGLRKIDLYIEKDDKK
ncbi:Protein of unknown function [Lactobacillus helveticus CIRM-BIA 101]|uniref:Uncharacterized protein n=1 Tax=Lactobacillus helveticus CIRM-BIA 104 TaxID=1226333 RepID=U6FAG1_LACHE|nr:Protein of unknown function [Lactobacillus helveticus CIRM-BIA 104]CDI62925.1 Protein of unknown function [Lactobacillus helveticus CIRM-BIA 103]CDI64490.1 Protein of unknown function [Lactobacillus helveticus CIRM-BIA 101]